VMWTHSSTSNASPSLTLTLPPPPSNSCHSQPPSQQLLHVQASCWSRTWYKRKGKDGIPVISHE
jgi:hypothetical protein